VQGIFFSFFFFLSFLLLCSGYIVAFTKVLILYIGYLQYIIVEFTPSIILLYPPSLIPGIVSTGIIFPFTYVCTQYLYYFHLPMLFPHFFPPPTGTNCPPQALLFSNFVKEKKLTFLFKLAIQGVSL
jgi:hypothetical protein